MSVTFLKRNLFQRLLGIPATGKPGDPGCWRFDDGVLTLDLERAPELHEPGGAIRLEGKKLPVRVLILRGQEGTYHAFRNRCTHIGHRRLDPVPGTDTVQCCSVGKSTYDLEGRNIFGPAPKPLQSFPVTAQGNTLIVKIGGAEGPAASLGRSSKAFRRLDSDFESRGVRCSGRLYLPAGISDPPVVVMGHGFAAEKTFGLTAFAERFAENGIASFAFDYRNFGASDGTPRNLVRPSRHLQDWEAAVRHVRSLKDVDGSRTALWGSSFSGGHVLVTAARLKGISAVVSQVPFVDGLEFVRRMGFRYLLKALSAGIRDVFRMATLRGRHTVPVVGKPGDFAVLNTPDAWDGYMSLVPKESGWKNACPAAFLLTGALYRPIRSAKKVRCPVLLMPAEEDAIISLKAVSRTASRIHDARIVPVRAGHFDVYHGDLFSFMAATQVAFLKEHLKAGPA